MSKTIMNRYRDHSDAHLEEELDWWAGDRPVSEHEAHRQEGHLNEIHEELTRRGLRL